MRYLSFRMKLMIGFIITAMIEGILIGSFSYFHSKDLVVKNKKQEMSDTINRLDININERVRYIMEMMDNASSAIVVQDACLASTNDLLDTANLTELQNYFENILISSREQVDISLIVDHKVIYTTSPIGASKQKEITSEVLNSYDQALGMRTNVTWAGIMKPLFTDSSQQQVVTVAKTILSADKKDILGILILELNPDVFQGLLLGNQGLFQYQYLLIMDKKGQIIASNPNIDHGWQKEINRRFDQGSRRFYFMWNNRRYYVCSQYNGLTGWKTYSVIPEERLFPQASELRSFIWLVVIFCTFGIAMVIALLVYAMARPIKHLSKAMGQVQKGDFTVQVSNKRYDEIGELTDSFNYMINTINTLIRQVYQEKLAQKNAEIQALQAQINPHFLYNTLDSINWMLIDRSEFDISEIVISLGSLMRYSIEEDNVFVTLEREVEYVLSYLNIQKNRLEERLVYQVEMDESVRCEKIPKLILQPLIENAITHGIEPRKQKGKILVLIKDEGQNIGISIQDDGIGMSHQQLNQLNERICETESEGYTQIGVRNVNRRIQLHYGEQCFLRITSEENKGTTIKLHIPKSMQLQQEERGSVKNETDDCR